MISLLRLPAIRPRTIAAAAALVVGLSATSVAATRPEVAPAAVPAASPAAAAASTVVPVTPFRILDTRTGIGATPGLIGSDTTIHLQVAGVGAVPADATGVVLNLTVSGGTEAGWVAAWPTSEPRPNSSVLNVTPGQDLPNMITAALGYGGQLDLYNFAGEVHLIADVAAYLVPAGGAGSGPTVYRGVRELDMNEPLVEAAGGEPIVVLDLPAGSYHVTASIGGFQGAYDQPWAVTCGLTLGNSGEFAEVIGASNPATGDYETDSLTVTLATTIATPGSAVLQCGDALTQPAYWSRASITAIAVGQVIAQDVTP